jgi:hypothetical protein
MLKTGDRTNDKVRTDRKGAGKLDCKVEGVSLCFRIVTVVDPEYVAIGRTAQATSNENIVVTNVTVGLVRLVTAAEI